MRQHPKPTKLKILEGNRGRRPITPEPEPPKGAPKMPQGMPERAKTLWKRLVFELDALNLITVVDGAALEGAVVAYAHATKADRAVERIQGDISKAERSGAGSEKLQHLYYRLSMQNAASKKAWTQYRSFCVEFGLTPSSRTRLTVGDTIQTIDTAEAMVS